MNDKKLSEELDEEGLENSTWDFGRAADEARALEERVSEAEYDSEAWRRHALEAEATLAPLTARAEAAEKECTELREIAAQRCTQAEAAEARLATARLTYEECMETQRQLQASRDEAWAESDAAEAEVARLRSEPAWQLAQNLEATMRTADAAERKLEMHIAAHDMTSDQLQAAEAERKEFMLETQRKEIECNKLASEVARLRGDMRVEVENHEATIATVDRLIIERDALRAENVKLLTFTDDAREQDLFMVGYKHMRAADALRAKLEMARAIAQKGSECQDYYVGGYCDADDILAILDGEGGDE